MGSLMKGSFEQVLDFDAPPRPDGSRPQQIDKETGLPLWQVTVLDVDDQASRRDTAVTVKIAAPVQPVPPDNESGMPLRPVEFVGLTALAYVEYLGGKNREGKDKTRVAWSLRAEGIVAPGEAAKAEASRKQNSSGPRAA